MGLQTKSFCKGLTRTLILLGVFAPCLHAQEIEERADLLHVSEGYYQEAFKLRRHRSEVLQARARFQQQGNMASSGALIPELSLHFRLEAPPALQIRSLRMKFDDGQWHEQRILSSVGRWSTFLVRKLLAGQRNLTVQAELYWERSLAPLFMSHEFVIAESFSPIFVQADQKNLRVNLQLRREGWLNPKFSLRIQELKVEP